MTRNNLVKGVLTVLAALVFALLTANAQWSPDSSLNLGIGVGVGEQATAKLVETSDGGCYISWFDNRDGNYCMYLQRLNYLGEAQFVQNGLLISDHPQNTSLVDYDLTVDQNDNAVIVFTDVRNGSNDLDVFAYKIGPDGSFLWGDDGVGLSEAVNTDFEPAPKVTATTAGNFVVGWMKSDATDRICFQKLSADGQKLWGENGITISGITGERLSAPDLVPAQNDSVIAIWKNSTGPFWAPTTHLFTQKFGPNGEAAWGASGVLIYDLGHMSAWTYPSISPDGQGGALYTWYDAPQLSEFNVWVEQVGAAGNLIFPVNGIQASTNSNDRLHMYPSLSYLPATDELYVFWVEENWNQNQYGLYGQKISPQGERLWTDSGREFLGLGDAQISFVCSAPADTGIYVSYFQSPTVINTAVLAFRIDPDGALLWNPRVLSISDLGSKDDLLMVVNTESRAFLTWTDGRHGDFDIYAQNVNLDGTLGNPISHIGESHLPPPDCFRLDAPYPNPFNPSTTLTFDLPQASPVTLEVFDILGRNVSSLLTSLTPNRMTSAGIHSVRLDGSRLASGIYFVELNAGNQSARQKLVLMR